MEASNNNNNNIATFVMKTYLMVNDPTTDTLITWGQANNSFIVIDPSDFSQRILPAYFKHNNFSSFVRQLNTYRFRKVDPERWEFANEWFLRGQKELLKNIVRRKQCSKSANYLQVKSDQDLDFDDEEIVMEIARLKQEQKALEEELQGMNKRLETTEKRPKQMMAFLSKVVQDPDLLPRMILEKERSRQLNDKKRLRLMMSSSSSSSVKSEEEEVGTLGVISSSPEIGFDVENVSCQSSPSPETNPVGWLGQVNKYNYGCDTAWMSEGIGSGVAVLPPPGGENVIGYDGGQISYIDELVAGGEAPRPPPPYPFSLLGGGF